MRRAASILLRCVLPTAVLAPVAMLPLGGCAPLCETNFSSVHRGMTKDEVRDLLGKPSSTWTEDEGIERWQWGDNLSSLATGGVFGQADTSRVWAVWFSREGTVTDATAPDWARGNR